jgi:hypothetical protein
MSKVLTVAEIMALKGCTLRQANNTMARVRGVLARKRGEQVTLEEFIRLEGITKEEADKKLTDAPMETNPRWAVFCRHKGIGTDPNTFKHFGAVGCQFQSFIREQAAMFNAIKGREPEGPVCGTLQDEFTAWLNEKFN